MRNFTSIQEVVEAKLCSGCGACVYMQPGDLRMVDVPSEGLRPVAYGSGRVDTSEALTACPGIALEHPEFPQQEPIIDAMKHAWGPVRAVWEGFATDSQTRYLGSSGGVASALAVYALEHLSFRLVLHVGSDSNAPYRNKTVVSRTRDEVLARTGSRYAPASPCELLKAIEEADGPCLFIGKPCDIAAAQKARRLRPRLDKNLSLTVAFFCAGTPSTNGTLALLRTIGVSDINDLAEVRYRGKGWPGRFAARERSTGKLYECTYEESWGEVLSSHVQWRCRLCLDHTGEFADIALGDPWYRPVREGELGSSLIVARNDYGNCHIEAAIRDGALTASRVDQGLLPRSQTNLLRTRGEVWGRMLGARVCGARVPRYRRLPSFRFWLTEVNLFRKVRSVLGAARRCVRRGMAFKWFR